MNAFDYPNVLQLFEDQCDRYANMPFLWEKRGQWIPMTWNEFRNDVYRFGAALIERGITRNEGVAILSGNVKEWPICDLGTIYAGGVSVGLYPTSSATQCAFMIDHSDSKTVVVDHARQLEKILEVRPSLTNLRDIVVIDPNVPTDQRKNIWNIKDFLALGDNHLRVGLKTMEMLRRTMQPADTIMYVYTSGTTGDPKAAMISNRYFLYNGDSINNVFDFKPQESIISYLPFCHVGERIFGFSVSLIAGRQFYLVEDYSKVIDTLIEIDADIFGGVPRLYEKMYAKITGHIAIMPENQRSEIQSAFSTARDYFSYVLNRREAPPQLTQEYASFNASVLKPLREMVFGKKMRICTSGAAPLSKDVAEFFVAIGSPIYEAYGLTENISASINRPDKHRISTVGVPMPYCEIKLAEDGEILIKGDNTFSGYYKNETATRWMFDANGEWMLTGDIGTFDQDGFLRIIDRKKELLITSTGKNIAPAPIEIMLKYDTVISQSMIVGDGKSYIAALITINPFEAVRSVKELAATLPHDVVENLKKGQWPPDGEMRKLIEQPALREHIQNTIHKVNASLNHTEQIKKFTILPFDFSIERGEITPTLKLKRKVITERYKDIIEHLYHSA
ncbi:long-chain fatty acid--CoA ligase [bacterium]|nr:long-chain fatty acid--CoA ligase [bacterium]